MGINSVIGGTGVMENIDLSKSNILDGFTLEFTHDSAEAKNYVERYPLAIQFLLNELKTKDIPSKTISLPKNKESLKIERTGESTVLITFIQAPLQFKKENKNHLLKKVYEELENEHDHFIHTKSLAQRGFNKSVIDQIYTTLGEEDDTPKEQQQKYG